MRRIAIRADAATEIGSGHVMRCLALAEGLVARGAHVQFLCREVPGHMIARIEAEGHEVSWLPPGSGFDLAEDRDDCIAALGTEPVDCLIVDHYGLDARWESGLRHCARKIMVIDDMANRPHDCDLLLDQNLSADPAGRYAAYIRPETRTLFGPRYALLRPAFAEAWRERSGPVRRILVFFGGADLPNATAKAVAAVALLAMPDLAVDVVIGAMYAHAGELENLCASVPGARIHRDADMAALMRQADLAIGAGGTTTWERCAAGLPTLAWPIADNQRPVLAELAAAGAVLVPDADDTITPEGIMRHLSALMHDEALRDGMSRRARAFCDGRGVARVVAAMAAFDLLLAVADAADCETLYRWRNHPTVRANSTTTAPIVWRDHEQWFKASLKRDDRILLLGRLAEAPVGVVRFDRVDPVTAEVSIYLDPERLGEGIGARLLDAGETWMSRAWPQVRWLTATVKAGNIASERLFAGGGYARLSSVYQKELLH
jgi:UDP-2,4-diacetamido-2,4,6-trideoxy-beta-L-altropyranose hydrolase